MKLPLTIIVTRNANYSLGTVVNNIMITMWDVRWVLNLWGGHFVKYKNV